MGAGPTKGHHLNPPSFINRGKLTEDLDMNGHTIAGLTAAQLQASNAYNIDQDTTPKLGGDLDLNAHKIGVTAQVTEANLTSLLNGRPFSTTHDPSANDDGANTGGHGVFAIGNCWLNTTTGVWWLCESAATGAAVWRLLYVSKTMFGGYSPKRLAKVLSTVSTNGGINDAFTLTSNWTDHDGVELTYDTTNWKANDGTNERSILVTPTGTGYKGFENAYVVDLTNGAGAVNKHIGVRFWLDAANVSHMDKAWLILYEIHDAVNEKRGYRIFTYEADEFAAGWNTAYIVPNNYDTTFSMNSANAATLDLSLITNVGFYMHITAGSPYPTLTLDEIFTVAAPTYGYFMVVCEGSFVLQKRLLEYMRSKYGGYGSFSCAPSRLTTPGTDYLSWAQARALRDSGHFPYMYLSDNGPSSSGHWGDATQAQKLQKILYTREQLRNGGLIDEMGGYVAGLAGHGWSSDDVTNFLGTELFYIPSNSPIGGFVNSIFSPDDVFGHTGFSGGGTGDAALTAAGKGLMIMPCHASALTGGSNGYYLDYCVSIIDGAATAGLKFITIRDLLTGNIT
jgi:hypothetical protein